MPTSRHSTKEATLLHASSSIYWRTFAAFILLCFLGGWIVYTGTFNHIERQKQAALQLAGSVASSISQRLNASISTVYTLEIILSENQFKIDPQRFEIFATQLMEKQSGVSSLQYAPDGIVTYVVPLAGNESILGHNLFDDPKRNKEAFVAKKEYRLMVAGPFDLIQGGVGLVARLPIYRAEKTTESFWGFATVLIRLTHLLESAGVNSLLSQGYDWILWRDHPDTGQPHIFAGTTDTFIDDAIQLTISVPNATWFLNIKPDQGWLSGHYPQMALGIGIFLIMSGLVSYLVFLLQRQPFLLHKQVEERTRELLEANSKLLDSETRFRQVVENSHAWIWEMNSTGLYTFGSQAIEKMLGYTLEEIINKKHYYDFYHPEDQEVLKAFGSELFMQKQAFREVESRSVAKNGDIVWISTSGVPILDNKGKLLGYRGADINITERKLAEELRKRINVQLDAQNKELEQVIYVTCHDLRSPLITIEGFSEVLENSLEEILTVLDNEGLSPDTQAKIASSIIDSRVSKEYIRKGVSKMTLLLKGLSQVSRVGRVEVKREELDMNVLIAGILAEFEPHCIELGGEFQVADLPGCMADPGQANQLFTNLIGNALKYSDPNRKCIVRVTGKKEDGQPVYCVEDSGIGISPEHLKDIFEMFRQLNPEEEGEGLGLSIVRKIVERHNGRIWVESEVGKGSRFYVSL